VVLLGLLACVADPTPVAPADPLRLAVPAYAWPGEPAWADFVDGAAATGGLVVANPASGVGGAQDVTYVDAVAAARARGATVLGYVSTRYGARDAAEIDAEVAAWFDWYAVDGIFYDEVPDAVGCVDTVDWYAARAAVAREIAPGAFLAYNPGIDSCEAWLDQADLVVVIEHDAATVRGFALPEWASGWPADRFWLLAYAATDADMTALLDEARAAGVGWVYVTDDVLPNPWDDAPAFWGDEIAAASGG
jgi:hypothetical protein